MFERTCFITVCCAALLAGCAKKAADPAPGEAAASATAEAQAAPGAGGDKAAAESTIVEESDQGTITWNITSDGHVRALVKSPDGKVISKDVTGIVTWPGDAGDDIEYLSVDAEGQLVAQGPALEADLTEINYDLVVAGKPWSGVLHVPRGGTQAIAADAKVAADAKPIPPGTKGPNGGVVQYIGNDLVELVADKTTGEVRVYVLGPDLQVIDPGERRIRLGYVADTSETLDLQREPDSMYYVGRVRMGVDPVRVTLAMGVGIGAAAAVHVGIIGFSFGMRLGVGVRATPIPILVERHWTPSVAVRVGVGVGVGVDARARVGVGGRVDVRERERVRVHHDNGVRDHGAGHGREHVKVHDHGGGRGNDHGGGPKHGGGRGNDHGGGPKHGGGSKHGGGGHGKKR